jgi:hypothetical protein
MISGEQILNAYIEAALWSTTDDEGVPLDKNYKAKNIDPLTKLKMGRDVNQAKFLADAFAPGWREYWDNDHFGFDLWLTRNGEGSGFWSRAPTNPSEEGAIGEKLSQIAHSFSSVELYIGDDGVIYAL